MRSLTCQQGTQYVPIFGKGEDQPLTVKVFATKNKKCDIENILQNE